MDSIKQGLDDLGPRQSIALTAAALGIGVLAQKLVQQVREIDLDGKVALITGSSRGLGYLLAREFAREGCKIAICARDAAELDIARQDLENRGAKVLALRCDISDEQQVDSLVTDTERHYGQIDILVNNAGIIQVTPLEDASVKDFEDAMATMYWGVLYPTLAVLPSMMRRRSGSIVNITSIGGKLSAPHLLPYNSAKFAAVGLSEGLRAELAQHGISVTTICPGLMRTGSHLNALFKGNHESEFTWFSLGATLPGISMDAERAARQIVEATKRGEAEKVLGLPANLAVRFHGMFPGLTADMLGLVNRFILPKPAGRRTTLEPGLEIEERMSSDVLDFLTTLGRSAAARFHEYRGK